MIILYLIVYSERDKHVTYIVDFSSLQSEKSQLWSFFNSYSIRHTAEMRLIVHFLFFISYFIRHATKMWHTSSIFHVLRVQSVNFDHSLTRTLFGTQQKCDIYRTIFRFYRVKKKAALVILCLVLYSAPIKNVTYIVDFSGFKSENSQLWSFFRTRTLFGMQQKCDLSYIFGVYKVKKSQVWSFSVSNSTRHATEIGHTSHIF